MDHEASIHASELGPSSPRGLLISIESMEIELPAPRLDDADCPAPSAFADATNHGLFPQEAPGDPPDITMTRASSLFFPTVPRSGVHVLVFGRGDCAQLGDGTLSDSPHPHPVEALHGKDIISVAAGAYHTVSVTADGELYCWGDNAEGQCSGRGRGRVDLPSRVEALESLKVGTAACGDSHTVVVLDDGKVLAFGRADHGALGIGPATTSRVEQPKTVKALKEAAIVRVAAGGNHTLLLSATGTVYATGDGTFGALGLPPSVTNGATSGVEASIDTPRPLLRLWPTGICQVSAGEAHSAALTIYGTLYTWGRGRSGALGLGNFLNGAAPEAVRSLTRVKLVTCGADHTVALTTAGETFTWGQGKWGATGLGHAEAVCVPQRVPALEGRHVVQASAGGRHTLFLMSNNEVWAAGANDNGQCGHPQEAGTPTTGHSADQDADYNGGIVVTPRRIGGFPADAVVLFVTAGGDHSIVVAQRPVTGETIAVGPFQGRPHGERWLPSLPPPLLAKVRAAAESSVSAHDVADCLERTFANPGYLITAFSQQAVSNTTSVVEITGEGSSLGVPPLDIPAIGEAYNSVLKLYDQCLVATLATVTVRLLDSIERYLTQVYPATTGKPSGPLDQPLVPELAWVPPTLFILLQNPLASDPTTYGAHIIMRIGRIIAVTLPAIQRIPVRHALQSLLSRLPADTFAARCVRPVQRYLTYLVETGRLGASRLEAMMAGVLLDVLRTANQEGHGVSGRPKIPDSEFYNKALSVSADWQAEYLAWVRHRESSPNALVSFCQMPFLLTPEAKSHILHGEAMVQKHQHMSAAAMQAFFQGQNPSEAGFLNLVVRRTHVMEDALSGLVIHADDLKKPLRVTFVSGGIPEPAQDEGGVRKEFFQLLVRDLFRADFGMFTYDDATRTHWFNPSSLESEEEYALVGALLGLAIYNAVLLDAHFPLVLYEKLLGGIPEFRDLKSAFPALGRGLQSLLDYEPKSEVEAVFCRNFEVEIEYFGEMQRRELKPGGADIPVTGENRREYVELYTKWVLETSISTQFSAFARGFLKVCGGPALTMFTPSELELLVCGLPHLDFDGLQKAAKYEGGYDADHVAVRWFWEILKGWDLERKRQFLMFTTGSDRAPVGGLGTLTVVIQRGGPDTDRLPTSHTCFNTLLLPEYSSKEKMTERLLTAITNAQGFGLQ